MKKITLINGKKKAKVSVFNRGLQYGDGLFETLVFKNNKILFLDKHLKRLERGCAKLKITPVTNDVWLKDILLAISKIKLNSGIIKIMLYRGESLQGYGFDKKIKPVRIVNIFRLKKQKNIKVLEVCETKYGHNKTLAGIKHCNRLEQVIAKNEVLNDGLMFDENNSVISTTMANIFIIKDNELITPDLELCGINGTRREVVLEIAKELNLVYRVMMITFNDVLNADEVFITNSVIGVCEIKRIDKRKIGNSNKNMKEINNIFLRKEQSEAFDFNISEDVKPKGHSLKYYLFIVILLASIAKLFYFSYTNIVDERQIIHIKKGATLNQISYQLAELKPTFLEWAVLIRLMNKPLQAGYYEIKPDMNVYRLLFNMSKGNIVNHKLTLIEGLTLRQYYQQLMADDNFINDKSLSELAEKYPEGMLYPSRYYFKHKAKISTVFERAHLKMQTIIGKLWQNKQDDLPLKNPYQAITLASLIEKETALHTEKKTIASVVFNRLKKGMKLQMDPSVIYAMGESYKGKLTYKDLKTDSPFNTYQHKGLPPGAISSVGYQSLEAALNPIDTDYLYFVAKKDGGHQFSKTYETHKKAVKKYLK
jgi:aminodeoxychorismate lyase